MEDNIDETGSDAKKEEVTPAIAAENSGKSEHNMDTVEQGETDRLGGNNEEEEVGRDRGEVRGSDVMLFWFFVIFNFFI